MHVGSTLFAQVMEFVPWASFARIVQRHGGNSGVRTLSSAEQFRAMAFAQLTWRESLRDIEATMSANASKLYAMGFRSPVRRSTLADANESRGWLIWSDLAALLIRTSCHCPCRPLKSCAGCTPSPATASWCSQVNAATSTLSATTPCARRS
jgi:hypothetical protein